MSRQEKKGSNRRHRGKKEEARSLCSPESLKKRKQKEVDLGEKETESICCRKCH